MGNFPEQLHMDVNLFCIWDPQMQWAISSDVRDRTPDHCGYAIEMEDTELIIVKDKLIYMTISNSCKVK